jgi:hypothetical protein
MNPLQQHYAWIVRSAIGLAASIQLTTYLVIEHLNPKTLLPPAYHWLFSIGHVSLGPLVSYLLVQLYDSFFWKTFHPQCDFSGCWSLVDHVYDVADISHAERAQFAGSIEIEQSATRLVIRGTNYNSDGTPRSTWTSTSCELSSDQVTITQSIQHMRFASKAGDQCDATLAVEVMRVIEWESSRFGRRRPVKLRGITYHCVNHHEKSYRVETEYNRISSVKLKA